MQIPIDTGPLRALDVPTRWLLSTALDDAAKYAQIQATTPEFDDPVDAAEAERKRTVYRQIAEAIRD
jgi:hypothetical protein